MKKITLMIMCFVCCSRGLIAANVVDIFGATNNHAKIILNKYTKQVGEIQAELNHEADSEILTGKENTAKIDNIRARETLLKNKIKKNGEFLFVSIHTTTYPNKNNLYTTIEVIEKNQPERLRWINSASNPGKYPHLSDLIHKMIEYGNVVDKLEITHQLNSYDEACPVYHCVVGFKHPLLKPYLKIFNQGAIREKKLIVDTLNHDKDPNRRAAAAFLVGHFTNPKEILAILLPHFSDKNSLVRNNVLRVVGTTIEKAGIKQIDVMPFLALLNSPYGTDRNKASYILINASKSASSKPLIIQHGKEALLSMLSLQQPNNHDNAYIILKNISGKKYEEYDINAWETWFKLNM